MEALRAPGIQPMVSTSSEPQGLAQRETGYSDTVAACSRLQRSERGICATQAPVMRVASAAPNPVSAKARQALQTENARYTAALDRCAQLQRSDRNACRSEAGNDATLSASS